MTLDELEKLVAAAYPGPYKPQRLIGTPEDVHRRQTTENLKALAPSLATALIAAGRALEKIEEGLTQAGLTSSPRAIARLTKEALAEAAQALAAIQELGKHE